MKKLITLIAIILIATANSFAYIAVSGNIAANQTWTTGNTYYVSSDVVVLEGITLTIEEDVIVKFNVSADLRVLGTLDVNGVLGGTVFFTSKNDDAIGEIIIGSTGIPGNDDWGTVIMLNADASATISYATFRYGGDSTVGLWKQGILMFRDAQASSIDHIFIQQGYYFGLFIDNTLVNVDNIDISNHNFGIYLEGTSTSTFSNVWLDPVYQRLITVQNAQLTDLSDWNITADENQYIQIYFGLQDSSVLNNDAGAVYVLESEVTANRLYVKEGTIIKAEDDAALTVTDGLFRTYGDPSFPVIFTSLKDDIGGDTNNDGSGTSPGAGDWKGIVIDGVNSSTYAKALIHNTWIRYGGANFNGYSANLFLREASNSSSVTNCRIEFSSSAGLHTINCGPLVTGTSFYNNVANSYVTGNTYVPNFGSLTGNNIFRNSISAIDNFGTHPIYAKGNDFGTNDSATISQSVGNNVSSTGEVYFDPWFEKEDIYWQSFDKTAIENAGVYHQLMLSEEDTPEGTIVLFQTTEGRYGKFKILNRIGNSMTIWWETFNDDGSTYSAGTNLNISGTGDAGLVDLDRGITDFFIDSPGDKEFYLDEGDLISSSPSWKSLIVYSYCSYISHSGGTSGNESWGPGTHYVNGNFIVYSGDTLFIDKDATVKFSSTGELIVNGAIQAQGYNDMLPIWFTSANDDMHGCIIAGSTGNPQPGDWQYISWSGSGEKSGKFRFCRFAYGGASSSGMLSYSSGSTGYVKQCVVEQSSSNGLDVYQADITVDSSTFQDNSNHGISYNYYSTVRVHNSSFFDNGNDAIITASSDIEPMENNQASGNNLNGVVILALGPGGYQRLVNPNSMPFIVYGSLYVGSGKSLNIGGVGPGTSLIKMNTNAKIQLAGGHLNASGATITSLKDDSVGGDTNNDGDATSPAPGDWQNIYIQYDPDSYIWGCHIYYGGSSTAAVYYANGAGGDLNNSEVKYSLNHGVYSSSAPLDIWACDIMENIKSGVYLYGNDSTLIRQCDIKNNGENGVVLAYGTSLTQITDNTIEDNTQYPIYYYSSSILGLPITGNTLDGNLMDAVVINSLDWYKKQSFFEIIGSQSSIKYSYVFLNSSTIYSTEDTLEFNAGAIVKFNEQTYLDTKGAILADGAIFTSIHDDTFGGDTENDGTTSSPAKGDWSYIGVDQSGLAEYDNCHFRFAGYNNYGTVRYYTGAHGFIKNSVVEKSSQDGITKNYGGNVEILNNIISENDRYGIYIYGTQDTLIIDGNQIKQSGSHAIYLNATNSTDINNNSFTDNAGYPVYYTGSSAINDPFTGNTSSGNLMEGFAINSINGYSHNIFHPQPDLPFIFLNSITSYSTIDTMEIKSSTVIKMFPGVKLEFRGPVITNGGLLTSIKDDAWGGDTNNDGEATVAAPGDWKGLELYNTWGEFDGLVIRYAGASSTPALNFNTSKGNIYIYIDSCAYDGLNLYNGSNVEVVNSHFIGNARYGININSLDTIQISNTTLQGNGSHGIYCSNAAPDIDNCTFTDNGGYPVYFASNSIINKEFTGNTSSGNLMEGFAVNAFGYGHNTFYHQDDLPFIFPNTITSYSTVDTFQIEQASFKFLPDVELEIHGPVIANGGVLTSIKDDTWDGDSNNDAAAASPAPGDWKDLEIYNTHGEFNGTKFRYAGASSSPALYLNTSSGYVDASIDSSAYDGLYLYNADKVRVENSEFLGNARYGIKINSLDTLQISNTTLQGNGSHGIYNSYAAPDIDSCTFTDNGGYPVYFTSSSIINKEFTGNSSSGNLMEGFAVNAFGYGHHTFYHQDDLPFIFPNTITSYSTVDTFQIEQASFKFLPDVKLEIHGPVIANGGVFTSFKDDAWDGDSNNDGMASSPAPGDWRGLELYHTHGEFNGTKFRYAGASSSPALYLNTFNGSIDVTIDSSAYDGLYAYNGSNVEIANSHFDGNARYGININDVDTLLITNSVIQGNGYHGVIMQYSNTKMRGNSITNNTGYGIYNYYQNTLNLGNNDVNDKGENMITGNDGGNYQLYNNTANEIDAYYNDWGYTTAAEIDAHIYDNDEDGSKGEVHFNPWYVYNLAVGVKAILEGPFNGTDMNTGLNDSGLLPLTQPFNTAPWNYPGSESVAFIPNADVVDWVLLELRDATNAASAGTGSIIDRKAGFLLKDGSIVDMDGTSTLSFASNVSENLFVVIHHRNHLKMMSANALTQSAGVYTYDFSTGINQAYLQGEKLVNGKAVMFGGDMNADGSINPVDKTVWINEAGTVGYLKSDVTFDGQSGNKDKNDIWVPNNGTDSQVPE